MTLSTASPAKVEPIVRVQRYLPAVKTFILASTKELVNSPSQNASREASTIRHVWPNIMFTAWTCSGDIVEAGGRLVTTYDITDANAIAPNPAQITRRERLYP